MDAPSPLPARQDLLEHARFVRALAGRLVQDSSVADDLAQEALLAGLRAPPRAQGGRAWLAGAVRNLFRMRSRSEARRRTRERTAPPPAPPSDPAQVLAQMEVQRGLVEAVLELREPYRSTIVHRYFHDLLPGAIAELLGVPVDTVRTRLARAHALLRERLDHVHGSRAAWTAPLLCFAQPHAPEATLSPTGALAMAPSTGLVAAVALLATGALGVWIGTRIAAPKEAGPAPSIVERAKAADPASPQPSLEGRGPGSAAGASAEGVGALSPSPVADAGATPAGVAAPPSVAAKSVAAKDPLDDVDWRRWIPTLVKYQSLEQTEELPEALQKEFEGFLAAVVPALQGRRWELDTELYRMPNVASRIAVAGAEHFGAKLTPAQRDTLRAEIEKAVTEDLAVRPDELRFEEMARTLQTAARVFRLLEPTAGEEAAAAVAGFLSRLLQDRGWGTLELGPVETSQFADSALQLFELRATLQGGELADAARLARDWWERAVNAQRELVRLHGEATVRAAVLAAADDDERTARARAAPTFPGVRVLVWAALAREQAAIDRAFHELWKKLPEERRKAFSATEPQLILFWTRGS